jgi:hypothetical protein
LADMVVAAPEFLVAIEAEAQADIEQTWYSTTEPVRLHATSSPSGLEHNGGPKRVLSSSDKRLHGGVPSSH